MKKNLDYYYYFFSTLGWFWLSFFVWGAIFNNGRVVLEFNYFNEMWLEFFVFQLIFLFLVIYPFKKIGKGVRKRDVDKNERKHSKT